MKIRVSRVVGAVIGLLIVVGLGARFLSADRYRGRLEGSISVALGRRVTIGEVHLTLFSGLGFSARNVVIADDPALSGEPLAYVDDLHAIPRLWTLWTGRLEFSSLTLGDAHLNLSRAGEGTTTSRWNFEPLLSQKLLSTFPRIHVRNGRINFKFEGRKSTFYLLNADLDVSPRASDGSDWNIRFSGEPARTDRPAHGFGSLQAQGRWAIDAKGKGHLELDARMDQSEMNDIIALVHGRDAGLHGELSGQVHLAGALDSLGVEGQMKADELHGRDQSPSGAAWPFRLSGTLDIPGQHIELFLQPPGAHPSISARFVTNRYLSSPVWQFDLWTSGFPLDPVTGILRNFGIEMPGEPRMKGMLAGDVHYASAAGWTGQAAVRAAAIEMGRVGVIRCDEMPITLAGDTASFGPAPMLVDIAELAVVSGTYALGAEAYRVQFTSSGDTLIPLLARFGGAGVPLLGTVRTGVWSGSLTYERSSAGMAGWSGNGTLEGATVALPLLAQPFIVDAAQVSLDAKGVTADRFHAHAGDLVMTGDYRYETEAVRLHHLRLAMGKVDASHVEALLAPALCRTRSLMEKALQLGQDPRAEWISALRADGTLTVDALKLGSLEMTRVRTPFVWDGTSVSLPEFQARIGKAVVAGQVGIDLRGDRPKYSGQGTVDGLAWRGGRVEADGDFETAGSGAETLANLKVNGKLHAVDGELPDAVSFERASGSFAVTWSSGVPKFQFPALEVTSDGSVWTGSGAAVRSGQVLVNLASDEKKMKLAGTILGDGVWTKQ